MGKRIALASIALGYVECGHGGRADNHGYLHGDNIDISIDGDGAADLAEDIFLACSSHDDLVAALRACLTYVARHEAEHESNVALDVLTAANAALAKAEPSA